MSRTEADRPPVGRSTAADRDRLRALSAEWEPTSEATLDDLLRYGELLLTWNRRINLTAAPSLAALIDAHFLDAFPLARRLPGPARVLDVGSGGGLPAIPLALLRPALHLTLCEPIAKKQAFLRTAVRELGLVSRIEVLGERAETLAESRPGFDAAVSRATFPPAEWLALAPRLVRAGGRVFALAAREAVPAGCPAELYLGGKRALIEQSVPEERST